MLLVFAIPSLSFAEVDVDVAGIQVTSVGENGVIVETDDATVVVGEDGEVEIETDNVSVSVDNESVEVIVEDEPIVQITLEERETIILNNNLGAKIRLLQLQKRVEFQIESADLIISTIEENGNQVDFDLEKLDEIIAGLENIIIEFENFDLEQESSEMANQYVALKDEAIELSDEFKKTLASALTEEQKAELRIKIKDNEVEFKLKKDDRIEKFIYEYNSEKVNKILARLGVDGSDIIEKVKSGELTVDEVKARIKVEYNSLDEDQKKEAKLKLKEDRVEIKVEAKERREEIKARAEEMREELKLKIQERRENQKNKLEDGILAKIENVQDFRGEVAVLGKILDKAEEKGLDVTESRELYEEAKEKAIEAKEELDAQDLEKSKDLYEEAKDLLEESKDALPQREDESEDELKVEVEIEEDEVKVETGDVSVSVNETEVEVKFDDEDLE